MPGLFSSEEKAEKLAALREEFPYLEGVLDAFRDNDLSSKDVISLISRHKAGVPLPGPLAKKFSSLDDDQKDRIHEAVESLCEAYAEFYQERLHDGIELRARDALEGLEGDIHKICNFDFHTPRHVARVGIEKHFRTQKEGPSALSTVQPAPVVNEQEQAEQVQKANMRTLAAGAAAVTGVVAGMEAAKHWRERSKKQDSGKKAVTFGAVTAVSAIALAAALTLGRSGGIAR